MRPGTAAGRARGLLPLALQCVLLFCCALARAAEIVPGIELREARIPMPDGTGLAADIFLPAARAPDVRLPVLLEYLPYRKDEARGRNVALYAGFLRRGYAVARVDIRGTGRSEGTLVPQEYSDIELADGEAVIAWLAAQPFSSGQVGMFGISWGGFNAIQMAARKPPALKAFVALHATDDLYREDVHFIDGIMHIDSWEMSQDLDNARPGAPGYVMDERYFRERFDTPPWMLSTKRQQRDGPYWRRVALIGREQALAVPGYFIGGWYDGYRNVVPRMLEHARVPVKGMIGPWSHAFPHDPYPRPGMEWRAEAARWFDQFLQARDTGILDEPRLAVYVRNWHPPVEHLAFVPGRWRQEDGWPPPALRTQLLHARPDHSLGAAPMEPATHRLRYQASRGLEAGGPVMWWGDPAPDQRGSDDYSLAYDTAPLDADTEILGRPLARLTVSADAPRANWFVRLVDVAPDGRATLVAGAGFNGMQRRSAERADPLVPGERFPLAIAMHTTSWVFPRGHRIRLAVSNAQWPMFWPTPDPMSTTLAIGGADGARVELPVVPAGGAWREPRFAAPEADPAAPGYAALDDGNPSGYGEVHAVTRDPLTGEAVAVATNTGGQRYPWGEERYRERIVHRTSDAHPENTSVNGSHRIEVDLPGRKLAWESETVFRSDRTQYHYDYLRRVYENGKLLREKRWSDSFPRD